MNEVFYCIGKKGWSKETRGGRDAGGMEEEGEQGREQWIEGAREGGREGGENEQGKD